MTLCCRRSAGINCGVLLIRNTDWARAFFADVGQYAYMPKAELVGTMRPVRRPSYILARDSKSLSRRFGSLF